MCPCPPSNCLRKHKVKMMAAGPSAAAAPVVSRQVVGDLGNPDYMNWFKAHRALNCTIKVLRPVCWDEMEIFQQELLKKHGPPCRRWEIDIADCRTWDSTNLNWQNSYSRQWQTNAWQLAKIYMSEQKLSCVNPADTDAAGIVQLLLNCQRFKQRLDTRKVDAVRRTRNDLAHIHDNMEMSKSELQTYIQRMVDLLKTVHKSPNAILTVKEIQKIETTAIEVNDSEFLVHEREVWMQFIASFKDDIKPNILKLVSSNSELANRLEEVTNMFTEQLKKTEKHIIEKVDEGTEQVKEQMKDTEKHIIEKMDEVNEEVKDMKKRFDEKIDEGNEQVKDIQSQRAQPAEQVTQVEDSGAPPQTPIKLSLKEQLQAKYSNSKKHDALDGTFVDLRLQKHCEELLPDSITCRDVEKLEKYKRSSKGVLLSQLFSKLEEDKDTPKKVLIRGRAGVGKTSLVEYMAREWAAKKLWPDVDYVFVLKLREFLDVKWSLGDLLLGDLQLLADEKSAALEEICQNSERVLCLLDGLDECQAFEYSSKSRFPKESEVDLSEMISSIISCSLLLEAKVVVTSRPTNRIPPSEEFDRVVDVYGFTKEGIRQYVYKFCVNDEQLRKFIQSNIDANPNLATICHTPIQCCFVCTSLKNMFAEKGSVSDITTMTQLYTKATHRLGSKLHPSLKYPKTDTDLETDISMLKMSFLRHAALAKDCTANPLKLIFSDEDLKQHSFEEVDKQAGFLSQSKKVDPRDRDKKLNTWSFCHLSLQEFFAALGLLQGSLDDAIRMLLDNEASVKWYEIVITFLAGLLGDPRNEYYLKYLGLPKSSLVSCKEFIKKLTGVLKNDPLKILTVVFETQCKDLVDNVPEEIESTEIYPMEVLSLCWVLEQDTCRVTSLHLGGCDLDIHLTTQLCNALRQNTTIQNLGLSCAQIDTDEAGEALGKALQSMMKLRELHLDECRLTPVSLTAISRGLGSGCEALEKLHLKEEQIDTVEAGEALGNALQSMLKLRELHLNECRLTPVSLTAISRGLGSGCEALEKLYLVEEQIDTVEAGEALGNALQSMLKLRELYLVDCHLTPVSLTAISRGLGSGCKALEKLYLNCEKIYTDEAGQALVNVLQSMTKLRELHLVDCRLTPVSLNAISRGLGSGCKALEKLHLNCEQIYTDEAGQALGNALQSVTKLRELHLVNCRLTPVSLTAISRGLGSSCDALEALYLSCEQIYHEKAGQALGNALQSMTKLRELYLVRCNLTPVSLTAISRGLGSGCKALEKLYLSCAQIDTDEAGQALGKALQSMMKLRELHLVDCHLTPVSLTAISRGLGSGCKALEKLYLNDNRGLLETSNAGQEFAEAVRSMKNLCELNLDGCDLTTQSVTNFFKYIDSCSCHVSCYGNPEIQVPEPHVLRPSHFETSEFGDRPPKKEGPQMEQERLHYY